MSQEKLYILKTVITHTSPFCNKDGPMLLFQIEIIIAYKKVGIFEYIIYIDWKIIEITNQNQ